MEKKQTELKKPKMDLKDIIELLECNSKVTIPKPYILYYLKELEMILNGDE